MKNKVTILVCIAILPTLSSFANDQETINHDANVIHLIGELHDDAKCIKLKNRLLTKAKNGQVSVALEGMSFGASNEKAIPNVFGIEDMYTKNLQRASRFHMDLVLYKISKDAISLNDKQCSRLIKYAKESFYIIFPSSSGNLWDIFILIDDAFKADKSIASRNSVIFERIRLISSPVDLAKITENHSFENPFFLNIDEDISRWVNLYKDITDVCLAEVIKENEAFFSQTKIDEIKAYVANFQNYANIDAKQLTCGLLSNFHFDVIKFVPISKELRSNPRNEAFLKNIINIFQNKAISGKPFYVIVGSAHAPFLYEKLMEEGYKVTMNDLAQEEYNRHLEESSVKTEL